MAVLPPAVRSPCYTLRMVLLTPTPNLCVKQVEVELSVAAIVQCKKDSSSRRRLIPRMVAFPSQRRLQRKPLGT